MVKFENRLVRVEELKKDSAGLKLHFANGMTATAGGLRFDWSYTVWFESICSGQCTLLQA
jgi:hypothetical protein